MMPEHEVIEVQDSASAITKEPRPSAYDYAISQFEPLLVTISETQRLIGYKKTKTNELLNAGVLERRYSGRAVRVTMSSIRRFAGEA